MFEVKTIGWNGKDGAPAFHFSLVLFWKQWWLVLVFLQFSYSSIPVQDTPVVAVTDSA
jgi:hypothetical protein